MLSEHLQAEVGLKEEHWALNATLPHACILFDQTYKTAQILWLISKKKKKKTNSSSSSQVAGNYSPNRKDI